MKRELNKDYSLIHFKLTCSEKLTNSDGSMNESAIIVCGKALFAAQNVLGTRNFLVTKMNSLILDDYPSVTDSRRIIEIDISQSGNANGFLILSSAISKNTPVNSDIMNENFMVHFHDEGKVKRIGYDPETKHLFIF